MTWEIGDYRLPEADDAAVSGGARGWRRGERVDSGDPVRALVGAGATDIQLFGRIVELTGSVRHPHLVTPREIAENGSGDCALVVDDPGGGTLAERVAPWLLTSPQALTLLAGVAAALEACHRSGIVHGNVSPDAVWLTAEGRPVLSGAGAVQAARELGTPATRPPAYASPDLARGAAPTARDDMFALGAVALEAVTGRPAWPADELRDVIVQSEFGQWPTPAPEITGRLGALISGLLDPSPGRRPTATELLSALPGCGRPAPIDVGAGRHAAEAPPELPDGVRWLDVEGNPGWQPPTPEADPTAPRRRLRRSLTTLLVVALLAAASIGIGIWWASIDRPAGAAAELAAAPPSGPAASADPDWVSVIRMLDEQRAAAFAARDPAGLAIVYTAGSAALTSDAALIAELAAADLRIDAPLHVISSVEPSGVVTATGAVELTVVDSLPSYAISDAAGATVGHSAATDPAQRTVTLVAADGAYLISAISGGPG